MRLYNTLSRSVEEFKPLNGNFVRMYNCGPTVYNFVHIGNLRTFLFEDVLVRWLKYRGFDVFQVKNLTDVDDKTIRDSKATGKPLKEFTEFYTKEFLKDMDSLGAERPNKFLLATDHIGEMVDMIKQLLEQGVAYKADDGIYFSISKFEDYGKLSKVDLSNLKPGASGRVREDEYDKENAADFALWKFWDENDGDVFWETDLGKGRPGWHIECSAMSAAGLTNAFENSKFNKDKFETIDIHTGGVDLVFPHHEAEIAQTQALAKKHFANFWVHAEHLLVNNKKMSKSLGNFYTLRDLTKKGYSPVAVRYLLISSHYRHKLNFTFESLDAATTAVSRLNDFVVRLSEVKKEGKLSEEYKKITNRHKTNFESALDSDLEMSTALASVFELMSKANRRIEEKKFTKDEASLTLNFLKDVNKILAVFNFDHKLEPELQKLVDERAKARKDKDFKRSDELRVMLEQKGIIVEDTPSGQRWKRLLL